MFFNLMYLFIIKKINSYIYIYYIQSFFIIVKEENFTKHFK